MFSFKNKRSKKNHGFSGRRFFFTLRLRNRPYRKSAPLLKEKHPLFQFILSLVNNLLSYVVINNIVNLDPAFIQYFLNNVVGTRSFLTLMFHNFLNRCLVICGFLNIQTHIFFFALLILVFSFLTCYLLAGKLLKCSFGSTKKRNKANNIGKSFAVLQKLYERRNALDKQILRRLQALVAVAGVSVSPTKATTKKIASVKKAIVKKASH
jgi:hypothetical protein